jgi:hypothetical protein
MAHDGINRLRASLFRTSRYAAGDEILFEHAGLLSGTVERVTFSGRKVRYTVSATLTFDVPESLILGRESDVTADAEEKGGLLKGEG